VAGKYLIGCQPHYYARALVYALGVEGPRHRVVFAPAAELAAGLMADELDVAMISSIDFFRHPGLVLLPDMSVSAQGAAGAGFLAARTGIGKLRRVAIDPHEPALAALAAIFLFENAALKPEWLATSAEKAAKDKTVDAWVTPAEIRAPEAPPGGQLFDLGELWWRFARLPFVYSVWATRAAARLDNLDKDLLAAKREGLRRVAEICEVEAHRLAVPQLECSQALARFRYDLSRVEQGGLQTFHKYAVRAGLLRAAAPGESEALAMYRG
jgi:chorismate dehydratase